MSTWMGPNYIKLFVGYTEVQVISQYTVPYFLIIQSLHWWLIWGDLTSPRTITPLSFLRLIFPASCWFLLYCVRLFHCFLRSPGHYTPPALAISIHYKHTHTFLSLLLHSSSQPQQALHLLFPIHPLTQSLSWQSGHCYSVSNHGSSLHPTRVHIHSYSPYSYPDSTQKLKA